tara:strand:- start:144 stop:416 length:273 start_codon:yes stop_codon:yes gene_type:complete
MDKFEYNDEQSRNGNYDRWKQMNNRERFQYNERPLSSEQAISIFDKLYPKINMESGITINDKWRKGTFWERKDNWSYDANGAPVKGESNE